jgi:hypothetical protein
MQNNHQSDDNYNLQGLPLDILSHPARKDNVHILTLDSTLAADIYERISSDPRTKDYQLIIPKEKTIRAAVAEIDAMARDTVSSRLLIIDVRRATLPKLQNAYNKVVGYNRRDLNKLCYTILIGDGPLNLFTAGKSIDVFVPHLSTHRIDYHPAVFFYDPFLHYQPDELPHAGVDDVFVLPDTLPARLAPYFTGQGVKVHMVRRYFRAAGKSQELKKERLDILTDLYEKRIAEQFPHHKDQSKAWLSKEGIRLANEKLHLYPLFFEDWVYDLVEKAAQAQT